MQMKNSIVGLRGRAIKHSPSTALPFSRHGLSDNNRSVFAWCTSCIHHGILRMCSTVLSCVMSLGKRDIPKFVISDGAFCRVHSVRVGGEADPLTASYSSGSRARAEVIASRPFALARATASGCRAGSALRSHSIADTKGYAAPAGWPKANNYERSRFTTARNRTVVKAVLI